jgi:hypothetical protein
VDVSPWIRYSLVRLGVFGGVFALLYSVGVAWWVGLIFATILSFTVGYIFLGDTRRALSRQLGERFTTRDSDPDAEAEDSSAP